MGPARNLGAPHPTGGLGRFERGSTPRARQDHTAISISHEDWYLASAGESTSAYNLLSNNESYNHAGRRSHHHCATSAKIACEKAETPTSRDSQRLVAYMHDRGTNIERSSPKGDKANWPAAFESGRSNDLSTRALHIDVGKNIIDVHLARRLRFGECWADIEELYLKYIVTDGSPSFALRTVLEGNTPDALVCPRLKILDVVMPPPILNADIRRKNTLQELRRMAQIRRSRNILEGGHCGWFTASSVSDQKTIEEASRDWWNIEWFKLLE